MEVNRRFPGSGHPPGALHRVTPHLGSDTEKLLSLHVTTEEVGCWGVSLSVPANRSAQGEQARSPGSVRGRPSWGWYGQAHLDGTAEVLPAAGVRTAQAHRDVGLCPWGPWWGLAGQSESLSPVTLTSVI